MITAKIDRKYIIIMSKKISSEAKEDKEQQRELWQRNFQKYCKALNDKKAIIQERPRNKIHYN